MWQRLRAEHGYAAIVAIMVVLVLTLIGASVLESVMNSFKQIRRTELRGEAEYYARMGMDEALARLSQVMVETNASATPTTPMTDIEQAYESALQKHFDTTTAILNQPDFTEAQADDGKTWVVRKNEALAGGNYTIYMTYERKTNIADPNPNRPLVDKVTLRVVGRSMLEARTLETIVYVNSYPDEFHYVLSAREKVQLYGAPYIEGDSYADHFTMSNIAQYRLNNADQTYTTTYPSLIGQIGVPYDSTNPTGFFKHHTIGEFKPVTKELQSTWYRSFVHPPQLSLTMQPQFASDLPLIATVVDEKRPTQPFTGLTTISNTMLGGNLGEMLFDMTQTGTDPAPYTAGLLVEGGVKIAKNTNVKVTGDVAVGYADVAGEVQGGMLVMETAETANARPSLTITNGSLYVKGSGDPNESSATLSGTLSVAKDVFINGNTVIDDLDFNGRLYIKGDLKIQGNFRMNGTIYVDGNVRFTEDDETPDNNFAGQTLVILASKTVEAYNLNLYKAEPQEINAFVYSEEDVNLYGIGSNIRFVGGIHGKNVTLNAIRAQVTGSTDENGVDTLRFVDLTDSNYPVKLKAPRHARLGIVFNLSLYETPPIGLPTSKRYHMQIVQFEFDTFEAAKPMG